MMTSDDDLNIFFSSETPDERSAYRVSLVGKLSARVTDGEILGVNDVSATGISFFFLPGKSAQIDMVFDLYVGNKIYLRGLRARLARRINTELVAYSFEGMSPQQEYRLDRLVLEMQKYLIELNRVHMGRKGPALE